MYRESEIGNHVKSPNIDIKSPDGRPYCKKCGCFHIEPTTSCSYNNIAQTRGEGNTTMGIKKSKKDVRAKRQRKREKEKRIKDEIENAFVNEHGTVQDKALREQAKNNKILWHKYPDEKPQFGKYIIYSDLFDESAVYIGECRNINDECYIISECHRLNHFPDGDEQNEISQLIKYPYWIYLWELASTLFDQCGIVDGKTWDTFDKERYEELRNYPKEIYRIDWDKISKAYK